MTEPSPPDNRLPPSLPGKASQGLLARWTQTSLVLRIVIGLIAGTLLALLAPSAAMAVGLLGTVFVSALKAVAPILVLVLVAASIANHRQGQKTHIRPILVLYLVGTLAAAMVAVAASFMFPVTLHLGVAGAGDLSPPGGIGEVLRNLLLQLVDNPIHALQAGNYIGILAWAVGLGVALRYSADSTRTALADLSDAVRRLPPRDCRHCLITRSCWPSCWDACCLLPW